MNLRFLAPLFASLVAAAFIARAADEWSLPPEKPQFKAGKGAELVQANCLICHSSEYITTQPAFTRDQWKASVTKMQQKFGAPIPPEHIEPLADYLAANYGKAAR
jgi:hypothetical protein